MEKRRQLPFSDNGNDNANDNANESVAVDREVKVKGKWEKVEI